MVLHRCPPPQFSALNLGCFPQITILATWVAWTRTIQTLAQVLNAAGRQIFTPLPGLVGAPACGDVMKLQIQFDEHGRIVKTAFKTFGCGSAIAASSLATTLLIGKTAEEAL